MKKFNVMIIGILFLGFSTEAHAYIDPATGSLIIQIVIGALAAAILFFKGFWYRIKSFFGMFKRNNPATAEPSSFKGNDSLQMPEGLETSEKDTSSKNTSSK